MTEAEDAGRQDFLENRPWSPPPGKTRDQAWWDYGRGWSEGRAIRRQLEHGTGGDRERRVTYGDSSMYYAWDAALADRCVRDAGNGASWAETGRSLDERIRSMETELADVRRRIGR